MSNIYNLPSADDIKNAYKPNEEIDVSFLIYDHDIPESPFMSLMVKAMQSFAEVNEMSVFELYAGLGTQLMLAEGLIDFEGDDDET